MNDQLILLSVENGMIRMSNDIPIAEITDKHINDDGFDYTIVKTVSGKYYAARYSEHYERWCGYPHVKVSQE